jgi:hypothetical protein
MIEPRSSDAVTRSSLSGGPSGASETVRDAKNERAAGPDDQ